MATDLDWLREFLGASASDISFLRQARAALLTHPKISVDAVDADAAMCRVLIVTAVTAIERTIEAWRDVSFLKKYKDNKISNGEKIRLLRESLEDAKVAADRDVVEDYLAIKYLRNTAAHSRWCEAERKHIQERDFPTELRDLGHRHWMRILATAEQMLVYFSQAALQTSIPFHDDRFQEMTDLEIAVACPGESRLVSLLLLGPELPTVWWRNLENLQDWISRDLVVSSDEPSLLFSIAFESWRRYLDTTSLGGQSALKTLDTSIEVLEKLHGLRIYPRGPINVDLGALAGIPDDVRNVAKGVGLSQGQIEAVERALATIREIVESSCEPKRPLTLWSTEVPTGVAVELLPLFVHVPPAPSREEVIDALRVGWQVYESRVNRVPLDLFLAQLPRLVPNRRAECLEAGRAALTMFKLRTIWHAWVESIEDHPQPPPYEVWRHFDRLVQELEAT